MTGDPLAWIEDDLAALDVDTGRRRLRHHHSAADRWLDLDDGRRVLQLSSNNYLGLATDDRVVEAAVDATRRWGTGTGSSRLVTGAQSPHRHLEQQLAAFKGMADARLFSSGYLANLGVVTALVGRGDTIVSDALNHASIIDACRLSGAETRVYRHGDAAHAAALLRDAPGRRLVITDGVFSMDGDLAPLPALCDAAERYGAMVVVDDAHGSGVVGPDGRGTAAHLGVTDRVHAIVGTLSKSLASQGGYVAASRPVVELLTNRARSFVFDTALAPPAVAAADAALGIALAEPERRERLVRSTVRLRDALRGTGLDVPAQEPVTPILPVVVGSNDVALAGMDRLLRHDVLVVAIRPPTVPDGTARLRATLMATHTDDDVDHAVQAFRRALTGAAA